MPGMSDSMWHQRWTFFTPGVHACVCGSVCTLVLCKHHCFRAGCGWEAICSTCEGCFATRLNEVKNDGNSSCFECIRQKGIWISDILEPKILHFHILIFFFYFNFFSKHNAQDLLKVFKCHIQRISGVIVVIFVRLNFGNFAFWRTQSSEVSHGSWKICMYFAGGNHCPQNVPLSRRVVVIFVGLRERLRLLAKSKTPWHRCLPSLLNMWQDRLI